MKKRAHYSANFKAQIVREILKEEKTIPQIAAEHGIHPNLLRRQLMSCFRETPECTPHPIFRGGS